MRLPKVVILATVALAGCGSSPEAVVQNRPPVRVEYVGPGGPYAAAAVVSSFQWSGLAVKAEQRHAAKGGRKFQFVGGCSAYFERTEPRGSTDVTVCDSETSARSFARSNIIFDDTGRDGRKSLTAILIRGNVVASYIGSKELRIKTIRSALHRLP